MKPLIKPLFRPVINTRNLCRVLIVAGTIAFGGTVITDPALARSDVPPLRDDIVSLDLQVEDWVETETARVIVLTDLAVPAGKLEAARAEAEEALTGIGNRQKWRITEFTQRGVDAGLERWHLIFEARLPASDLSDLGKRLEKAEKPGRGVRILNIDYSPTMAERQAAMSELRAKMYAMIGDELKAINKAFPKRDFRLRSVNFGKQPRVMKAAMMAEQAASSRPGMPPRPMASNSVAVKLSLTARVQLAAFARQN